MMPSPNCPDYDQLKALSTGRLVGEAADALEEHVDQCSDCQATLAGMANSEETLVDNLRTVIDDDAEFADETQCQAMIDGPKGIADESTIVEFGMIGEYQLLGKIGEGGMGTVYKALQAKLKKAVALKVLPKRFVEDRQALARFDREMEAIGAVDHPNIVRAMDAREIEGAPVLVMEYVDGIDLSKLVKRVGPLPVADACELIRQAAVGLQHVHDS